MATTIGDAQSRNISSIDVPDTNDAGTTEAIAPAPPQPTADSKGDARQADASKQYAKDNKPQMDARAGYIQQQLDNAYKNSMPKLPDPNTFVPKDADKKSDLPEQKPQYPFDASQHFVYADKDGGSGSGGPQNTPAPKTTGVNAKQNTGSKPPQTFDIMTVTPQEIKDLRAKKQDQLADTIENSKAAYSDFVKANPGVKVVVTTSDGNGDKPVLVVKGAQADKDAHVHTHYHGDNATVGDPVGSKAGQNARIRDTLLKDPHAVFVLPEAANAIGKPDSPSNNKSYGVSWSNVTSQVKTTNDALDAAGVQRPPKESVVSFHSGGGMALVNLVNNNKDKGSSTLQADRLELYDCVYHFGEKDGKILPAFHFESRLRDWSQTTSGQAVKQVIFYRGSNNVSRAAVMEQSVGTAKFKMIDMAKEPPLPKNPGFNPDPHYRTVGEFMGTQPRP
jgi:hypothetical protein